MEWWEEEQISGRKKGLVGVRRRMEWWEEEWIDERKKRWRGVNGEQWRGQVIWGPGPIRTIPLQQECEIEIKAATQKNVMY